MFISGIVAVAAISCSAEDSPSPTEEVSSENDTSTEFRDSIQSQAVYTELISKTVRYPVSYAAPSTRQGSVTQVTYTTRDYVHSGGGSRTNSANIYLPYGYDSSSDIKYNVLYLIHGHYGDESTFLSAENGLLRNVLDNMIAGGEIDPLIVVTPTYNYGSPTPNYVDALEYCMALPQELKNDLIPLIESRYHTYAQSVDEEGLSASRDHRAIGGFSMGGVTTWFALDETLPLFRWYLPMSGDCWSLGAFAGMNRPTETTSYLVDRIRNQGYASDGFYIWAASGTSDSAYTETLNQIRGMAQNDFFSLDNLTFHEKDNARHEYAPMVEYIYNALPFFFPKRQASE